MGIDLAVTTPAFLDLTFVGLEALPGPGEERFAGDLLRSPGGGAITVVAAARLGLEAALVAPLGDDLAGEFVRREVEAEGVQVTGYRPTKTPQTVVMPVGHERTMVTVDPGSRAAGEVILERAAALGCDLLVKCAYTQSRLRQMIFGGATRHILGHATLPVFMAH